jgi:hypothetical protein
MGAHDAILQLENVAYSKLPEIFVNDLSREGTFERRIPLKEKVLTMRMSAKVGFSGWIPEHSLCGKAEDDRG